MHHDPRTTSRSTAPQNDPRANGEKTSSDVKAHWEAIHSAKAPSQLSWHQFRPDLSLDFIKRTGIGKSSRIIDVGGGISSLVDGLLAEGYAHLTVLDISGSALQVSRRRLGESAAKVTWIEADITQVLLPSQAFDVWHDRAVFHFLTNSEDRRKYLYALQRSLRPAGHVIMASFALDGPSKCSGLDVQRYSPESMREEFGVGFELLGSAKETHVTPSGGEQRFVYCHMRSAH